MATSAIWQAMVRRRLNNLGADVDQLLLQARQRPILDRLVHRQCEQEIAEVLGERKSR
jgi:hypothetical protein